MNGCMAWNGMGWNEGEEEPMSPRVARGVVEDDLLRAD